jgi:hypothetical protein
MKTIHRIKNRGPNKLVFSAKLILRGVSAPSFGFAFDYCSYYSLLNQSLCENKSLQIIFSTDTQFHEMKWYPVWLTFGIHSILGETRGRN